MGTDIHMSLERQLDGHWKRVRFPSEDYDDRNYHLFAILAGVRNEDGFVPIAQPRGLPLDADIARIRDDIEDGHSHTWLSVAELKAFDWDQIATLRGWVSSAEYAAWKAGDEPGPRSYCRGVYGPGIVHLKAEEMDEYIQGPPEVGRCNVYTLVEWRQTYRRSVGERWFAWLSTLGSEDRLLLWFDS